MTVWSFPNQHRHLVDKVGMCQLHWMYFPLDGSVDKFVHVVLPYVDSLSNFIPEETTRPDDDDFYVIHIGYVALQSFTS